MFKSYLNNHFILIVKTTNKEALKDDLYGLAWHSINEKISQKVDPNSFAYLVEFIKSIDSKDEIIKRFFDYKNNILVRDGDLRAFKPKKRKIENGI
jgi:hypothetical protein